jgi:type III secretory pathway component EscT
MPDPLDYREPATTDAPRRRSPTRNAMAVGVTVFVVCAAAMFLPLAIPLGQLAKFVVTPAFVGACIGLSITVNALIDWWRGK